MTVFRPIRAETRTARMIEWFSGICQTVTDFIPGSKIRTQFETVAVEMEQQDFAFLQAVKRAIPLSIYQGFDFTLLEPVKATTPETFFCLASGVDITIPANSQISVPSTPTIPEKVYVTAETAVIPAGQTSVDVAVIAQTEGTVGNTPPGTITVIKSSLPGITGCTNANAVVNGRDRETEEDRRIRFIQYVNTLGKGIETAVVYGAETASIKDLTGTIIEQVTEAKCTRPPATGPAGRCDLYIYNGTGVASDQLIAEAQRIVDGDRTTNPPQIGWKAAGVIVTVKSVAVLAVDVNMVLKLYPGYDFETTLAQAQAITSDYLAHFSIGETFLRSELIERVMSIDGMYNLTLADPANDVVPGEYEVIVPGEINIYFAGGALLTEDGSPLTTEPGGQTILT